MKNVLRTLFFFASLALSFFACNKTESSDIKVSRLTLSETSIVIRKGDVKVLLATIAPSNSTDKTLVWTTNNSGIATVKDGLVTGVDVGKATVSATTADGRKKASCDVEVIAEYIPVESVMIMDEEGLISLNDSTIVLTEGDTYIATSAVRPGDATNVNVAWFSSDPTVASVKNGQIKAGNVGTATISIKSDAGGKTASFTVRVKAYVPPVLVTGVTLNATSYSLSGPGATYQLVANVAPNNADDKSVRWSTSDSKIVTVDNGLITAVAPGKATITVRTVDQAKTATCEVTVRGAVEGVSLNKASLTLSVGGSSTLTANVLPSDAINKNVTWSSTDETILTVDASGKVTAKASGIATVTVKTEEGGYTAKCTVIVVAGGSTGTNGGFDEFNESDFWNNN